MIIRPHERKTIIFSGIFVSFLAILSMVSIFLVSKDSSLFETKFKILTKVQNAQNLKLGAAVQLKGIKIGTIETMQFENTNTIKISLQISSKYKKWIKQDSYMAFKTQGVLGDRFLEILGGSEDSPAINNKDFLRTETNSQIDKFITKSEDLLLITGKVLTKIDRILSKVDDTKLESLFNNLDKSTKSLSKVLAAIPTNKLTKSITNLDKITTQIESGPGSMHSLIYDQSLHTDLKTLLGGANRNKILKYFIRESIKEPNK